MKCSLPWEHRPLLRLRSGEQVSVVIWRARKDKTIAARTLATLDELIARRSARTGEEFVLLPSAVACASALRRASGRLTVWIQTSDPERSPEKLGPTENRSNGTRRAVKEPCCLIKHTAFTMFKEIPPIHLAISSLRKSCKQFFFRTGELLSLAYTRCPASGSASSAPISMGIKRGQTGERQCVLSTRKALPLLSAVPMIAT